MTPSIEKLVTSDTIAEDIRTLTGDSIELARQKVERMLDPTVAAARHAVASVRGVASKTGEFTHQELDRGIDCIRSHPLGSVGAAVLGGVLLGFALLLRRS